MTRYKFLLLLNFVSEECVVTAAAVGIGLAIFSAAASAYGVYSQHEAQSAAAKQAEYDAEYQAEVAENKAEQEKLNRAEKEKIDRSETARRRAAQRASYAKSGVLLEGTPLTMLSEQAGVDEQNIQQGNLESRQKQANLRAGGQAALQSGKNISSAYKSKAKTNLIGGLGKTAASAYESYNWWDKKGPKK
jgi:hypothetical protein